MADYSNRKDNDDLQLVPEAEDPELDTVPEEEPYSPDIRMVPVRCSACELLLYTDERNIGKWKICPDCGRKTLIRKPLEKFRYVAHIDENGILQIKKTEDPDRPAIRIIKDYRTVEGSVDEGNERLPVLNNEDSGDFLEKGIDAVLARKKKRAESNIAPPISSDPIPGRVPVPDRVPVPKAAPDSHRSADRTPPQIASRPSGEENTDESPWTESRFFFPFFDPKNRRRFLFGIITGLIAIFMSFNLLRLMGQFLFSADRRGPDYVYQAGDILYFIVLYGAAAFPFALWMVHLCTNGMSLFDQTREGFSRIRKWIPFRADLALLTIRWLGIVLFLAPFPGVVISFIIRILVSNTGWRLLLVPASAYIVFPVFLLSIVENDAGLELYHSRIWTSLWTKIKSWIFYYVIALIPLFLSITTLTGAIILLIWSIPKDFGEIQHWYLLAALILCPALTFSVYFYFRLLGAHLWTINQEED
ncbi:MAG: hypothetical protein Q4G69_10695 [Planctomycetia bacterium]|nr:hypothetical protein [Planctomycetia bacterium]